MQNVNSQSSKVQQAQELQAKLEQLQTESSQLLLELTTLYGKYANVLQENISLKSRVGKLEGKISLVNAG
jgi:predicted nuclease with TOPRIM domain